MPQIYLLLLFVIGAPSLNTWAIPVPPLNTRGILENPVKVRVRLVEAIPEVSIHGFDLKIHHGSREQLALSPDRTTNWAFRCQNGRIQGQSQGKTVDLIEPVIITTPAGFLSFGNRPYRDSIEIYSVGSFCEVINEVDMEKYLDGLVNSEFSAKWNKTAMLAQVIAARTYAFYQIRHARLENQHFDVDATVKDQVYDGSIKEDFRASRAVENSRGMVLTLPLAGKNQAPIPIKAFYHSTCGGITELPQFVWGKALPGFVRPVKCPFCAASPVIRWEIDFSQNEITAALRARIKTTPDIANADTRNIIRQGFVRNLWTTGTDPQGRVSRINIEWVFGKKTITLPLSGVKLREWLGPSVIKSASFSVSNRLGHWHFQGRGNGHGVGMCQWGAKIMGERGYSMVAILKHYYPDAVLRKLW